MTQRHRLKLHRLDFISCVDEPAQQTAKVVLIKRAGGVAEEQVTALASVMKIGEGDDPYVYCWAFTCTDSSGAPYHDLQGDAISPDFLKAAEEFMRRGGASDEMHDANATGYVAFAFPMTADIAKGFFGAAGAAIKTSGLMIALRPSKEALAKFRSGEYTGVSIAGTGTREVVKGKRRRRPGAAAALTYKRAVLTSVSQGHAHAIDLDAPADDWRDSLVTSAQTAEGAATEHQHAWVYDPATGRITVADDSGHGHTVSEVVPADVLAAAAAAESRCAACNASCDEDDAYCPSCGARRGAAEAVAARAPAGISTPGESGRSVTSNSQESPSMDELAKVRKMLATALALTEPQRLHVAKLAPPDVEAFLAMDAAARDAAVKAAEATDPEVYKTAGGLSIRKSHGPVAEQLARQHDAQAAQLATQAGELAVSKAKAEQVELEKRAGADLSHFAKGVQVRAAILKAVDGIPDEAVRKEAIEALRGANAAMQTVGRPNGGDCGGDPVAKSALEAWNEGLAAFAKTKAIANPLDAIAPFLKTADGQALKKSLDAQRMASHPS